VGLIFKSTFHQWEVCTLFVNIGIQPVFPVCRATMISVASKERIFHPPECASPSFSPRTDPIGAPVWLCMLPVPAVFFVSHLAHLSSRLAILTE
jgi:hypothetical protein